MNNSDFSLDLNKQSFSSEGIEGLSWPYNDNSRAEFGVALMEGYVKVLNRYSCNGDGGSEFSPYRAIFTYFITEAIAVFWAEALRDGLGNKKKFTDFSTRYRYWPSIQNNNVPLFPEYFNTWKSGNEKDKSISTKLSFNRVKRIIKHLKIFKQGLTIDGLQIKRLTPDVLESFIVATQRSNLLLDQAKTSAKPVVFAPSRRWYKEISDKELQQSIESRHITLEKDILSLLDLLYKERGIRFSEGCRNYLEDFFTQGTALIRVHYERLLKLPSGALPSEVWTGTGGNLWDLLVRIAVIKKGGTAIGHDHGAGQGHVDNMVMGLNEFWGCNVFITFSKNQASELKKSAADWPKLEKDLPVIKGPNLVREPEVNKLERFNSASFKVKTILVPPPLYDSDRGRFGPYSSNLVYADWQVQLYTRLIKWGYTPILKPHPEDAVQIPTYFTTDLNLQVYKGPFSDIFSFADLVLFDHLYTSVFRECLETNIPVVLVDFYGHPWTPLGRKLASKRVSLVDAGFNEMNRRVVDWDQLKAAIECAPGKKDNTEYFHTYFA
ncbi:hypothetical protein [Kiloniella majae]|uniref:hypothetical protein n=1 Tax=Kiloniella majae TaxID=1938558 RepID=UPI000A277AD3|nr:hypothetical protein [Kiloniella majae]